MAKMGRKKQRDCNKNGQLMDARHGAKENKEASGSWHKAIERNSDIE